jgi:hypothetical protein
MSISTNKAGEVNGLVGGWIYHRGGSGLTGLFSAKGWVWEGKGAQTSGEWYLNQGDGKAYWMGPTQSEYPRISDSRFTPVELSLGGDKKIVWKAFFPVFSRGASPNHMAAGPTTPPRYNVTTSIMGHPPNQYSIRPYAGPGSAASYGPMGPQRNTPYAGPGSAASYVPMGPQRNTTYAGPGSAASYGQMGPQRNPAYAGPGSAAAYYRGGAKRRNTRRKQKKSRSQKQRQRRRTSRA